MFDHIHTIVITAYLWAIDQPGRHRDRDDTGERGDALTWVAITGGALLLAGAIYLSLKNKADGLIKHVCDDVNNCK